MGCAAGTGSPVSMQCALTLTLTLTLALTLTLTRHRLSRVDAVRAVEVAVRGDDLLPGQARRRLERVDVLREAAEQQALLVQQPDEVVHGRRVVVVGPQLARLVRVRVRVRARVRADPNPNP